MYTVCYRHKEKIRQLQESKATHERIIEKQNELIKTKGNEVERLKNQYMSILAEFKELEEEIKHRNDMQRIQQMQQEIDKNKDETRRQKEQSAEKMKTQSEIRELHGERFVFNGCRKGVIHVNFTVNTGEASMMGSMSVSVQL